MGVAYNPRSVTNNLVLALDAANPKSYPGTGTTWTDLSGFGNNTTLVNGISYSSNNLGTLTFDGVDDYVNFFAPNLGTTTTVEMWCNISSLAGRMMFGWLSYDVYANGPLGYNTANSDIYGISSATVTSLGLLNNWKHYVFEMRSDISYTNNKIYINAVSQTLSQISGSENAGGRTFNSGNGRIAGWLFDNSYRMPMICSSFKVYNRALTAAEITQNFNAIRGRYGI